MTSLGNFEQAVEATWEALTPPNDGSGATYVFIDDLTAERGQGRHRELIWRLSPRSRVAGVDPSEQTEWEAICELFIHRNDRTYSAFRRAAHDELTDLRLAFHGMPDLGTDVLEAALEDIVIEEVDPPRDELRGAGVPLTTVAVCRFNFIVLVQEP